MSRADVPAVERIIVNTINETARGDPELARKREDSRRLMRGRS
jgi:hypothetical protein